MISIISEIKDLVESYADRFSAAGIKCKVSKRYFERAVEDQQYNYSAIDTMIHEINEKQYNNQRNRYHSAILSFSPTIASNDEGAKEYAFLLSKTERPHKGVAPREKFYDESKILQKVETRVLKMLYKAERTSAEKACKNTILDALRYLGKDYGYKKEIVGKDRTSWEIILIVSISLAAVAILALLALIY